MVNIKLTRPVHLYYFIIFLIMGGCFFFGIYYFWQKGFLDGNSTSLIYEANFRFDDMKTNNHMAKVKGLVERNRLQDAMKSLESMGRETSFLHSVVPVDKYDDLKSSLEKTNKQLSVLVSLPSLSSLFINLSTKFSDLEKIINNNRLDRLRRVSRRLEARINPKNLQRPSFFDPIKISILAKRIKGDIDLMMKSVENISLSRGIKGTLSAKMKIFTDESGKIIKYSDQLKQVYSSLEKPIKDYNAWVSDISPEIALQKMSRERDFRNILWGMLGLVGLIVLGLLAGVLTSGWFEKLAKKKLERLALKIVSDGLIPIESKLEIEFSSFFEKEFGKAREYIHKRMSFAPMMQEGIPFAGLLLDSNLNLLWANDLFYKKWGLDDRRNDLTMSWDYLSQFTDISEDDPIVAAIKQGVSGIYNVYVSNVEKKKGKELLEMYVRPVSYANQKRIMVFFYSLKSVEQTIEDQKKSITEPISQTLDMLGKEESSPEFEKEMVKRFRGAGIEHLWEQLNDHAFLLMRRREDLNKEIEKTEEILDEQFRLTTDFKGFVQSDKNAILDVQNLFEELKNSVVKLIEMRETLQSFYQSTVDLSKTLVEENRGVLNRSEEALQFFYENKKTFHSIIQIGSDLKVLKEEVNTFRNHILRSVNQLIAGMKKAGGHADFSEKTQEVKDIFREFDPILVVMGKAFQSLNVGLSKVEIILNDSKSPDFEEQYQVLKEFEERFYNTTLEFKNLEDEFQNVEKSVGESFKLFHHSFKNFQDNLGRTGGLIKKFEDLGNRDDFVQSSVKQVKQTKTIPKQNISEVVT